MSTLFVSDIFNKAKLITGDPVFAQNSRETMLIWINEGELQYVKRKPDAYVKTADQVMVAGTKQALASDGLQFMEPICNMGTDGSTPGNVVYMIGKREKDRSTPGWHGATADAAIDAVMFNERNPKIFYVTPPQPSSNPGYLRYEYSAKPPTITVTDDNYDVVFNLGDECEADLVNYLLFRIYSIDDGQAVDAVQRAQMYHALWTGELIDKDTTETKNNPNVPQV